MPAYRYSRVPCTGPSVCGPDPPPPHAVPHSRQTPPPAAHAGEDEGSLHSLIHCRTARPWNKCDYQRSLPLCTCMYLRCHVDHPRVPHCPEVLGQHLCRLPQQGTVLAVTTSYLTNQADTDCLQPAMITSSTNTPKLEHTKDSHGQCLHHSPI